MSSQNAAYLVGANGGKNTMTYVCEFTCPECEKDFKAEWSFGDNVTCPHCQRKFETDYEESCDDIQGPWIIKP